jgi:ribosomal protein S27E
MNGIKVNRYTRAGYIGKDLLCPKCNHVVKVYHFAWSALQCWHCAEMVEKTDWMWLP